MKKKGLCVFIIFIVCICLTLNCYALGTEEVEKIIEKTGKEEASGNVFIWFLCAIAFMKVSRKIDSFLSALGITVGRTGGSVMMETMGIIRGIGNVIKSGSKFSGFAKNSSSFNSSSPAGKYGFFGGIGRKMVNGATSSVIGNVKGAGGMMASIGKKMYQNSVGKGGSFATGVIGSVARGDINTMGTISGPNGKVAMESYFGYNSASSIDKRMDSSSAISIEQGGATSVSTESSVNGTIDVRAEEGIPVFSEVEMGGGRITGMETKFEHPEGIQFAMYDADKYVQPESKFETVIAVDNSKWYKQYAEPTVEKTPYLDDKGKIQYNEKIVQRIPAIPMRKDRI